LLETLLAFVGVMLVLALAAQSVQELLKVMFAIKGMTTMRGLQGLLAEAAKAEDQPQAGPDLVREILERLRGLGQNGVRKTAVRIDSLSAEKLTDLIVNVDSRRISGIGTLDTKVAKAALEKIARHAEAWFPLAMEPVAERYRRRMRGLSYVSSALVVIGLNADALTIFRLSRDDPEFRKRVSAATAELDEWHGRVDSLKALCDTEGDTTAATDTAETATDTATTAGDTATANTAAARDTTPPAAAADTACAALKVARDSLKAVERRTGDDTAFLAGFVGDRKPGDLQWWIGILLSVLLVSLGAPFWHDLLEALFGLKNRVRAEAKKVEAETPPLAAVARQIGPEDVAVVRGRVDEEIP
jgi:hypothetical protein